MLFDSTRNLPLNIIEHALHEMMLYKAICYNIMYFSKILKTEK